MKIIETKIYSNLMIITDYLLLGILWVVVSLPLITFLPATLGALNVLQQWQENHSGKILYFFFQGFKKYFVVNLLLSSFSILFISLIDSLLRGSNQLFLVSCIASMIIYFMFLIAWIKNCTLSNKASLIELLKKTSFSFVVDFPSNIICLILEGIFCLLVFIFPPIIFVFSGGFWKITHLILFKERLQLND